MAAIVISDSDSEFERDIQEATRRSLMTSGTVTCQENCFDSDDDEERVPSWLSGVSLGTRLSL